MHRSDPTTLPRAPASRREAPSDAAEFGPIQTGPRPEPVEERMRGPGLVLLWGAMIAGSWALVLGIGYAVWRLLLSA